MTKASNIFLVGPPASGKTTIGRFLARQLNLQFHDSDKEVEALAGVSISWIFDLEGEAGFRRREQQVINQQTQAKKIVLATGAGVILASENRQKLAANGIVVYLKVSIEQQLLRIEKCHNRPLLDNNDRGATFESMSAARGSLYDEIADATFDTAKHSAHKVTQDIIRFVQEG